MAEERRGLAVELDDVEKVYRRRRGPVVVALAGINLRAAPGEFVALIGPSGCGKSTLLRLAAGLDAPSAGRIAVGDQAVAAPRPDIALVFQRPTLLPWRTTLANVRLPADARRIEGLDRRRADERARDLLALVGLTGWEDAYPAELSGGMQARVAIARALFVEPAVLLMDEPFGALDALTREELAGELRRIWEVRRPTVLFVTHDIAEAVALAERVVVLSQRPGRVVGEVAVERPGPDAAPAAGAADTGPIVRVRSLLSGGSGPG